jgi:hypothetical protein
MPARSFLAASLALTVTLMTAVITASPPPVEISDDGRLRVQPVPTATDGRVIVRDAGVPYGAEPDWQNDLRRQVGALQVADLDGDGWNDVVVGCYISNSYPPYEHWENLVYFNTGGALEVSPSWVSADEVSTGDVQVADLDGDGHLDIFAANGGGLSSPSVVYRGGPDGPDPAPDWSSAEPDGAWNNYALPVDLDGDGDIDVVTANQGAGQYDPYRPLYLFENTGDGLQPVPAWQSQEESLQNFLAAGDWDQDGWPEVAVSKWSGFASGILDNAAGDLADVPVWTTGDTDSDKGVAFADIDGDGWLDLALGHDPTQLWRNQAGTMSLVWQSEAPYHGPSDLRVCDVDQDGDPDLAECHFSDGRVHVYLNRGGSLDIVPSWTYDSPTVGTAIAFGDLNGDQWPDLVVGNSGEPCVKVFLAEPTTTPAPTPAALAAARLLGNWPNPFNPATEIAFTLSGSGPVTLTVHDAAGRHVRTLLAGRSHGAGEHRVRWDGRDARGRPAPAGIYLARLRTDGGQDTARLALVK